jgi:hypothetical protein
VRVEILVTGASGPVVAGHFRLAAGRIVVSAVSGWKDLMDDIRSKPSWGQRGLVTIKADPKGWLMGLPTRYRGSYLRAREVTT